MRVTGKDLRTGLRDIEEKFLDSESDLEADGETASEESDEMQEQFTGSDDDSGGD